MRLELWIDNIKYEIDSTDPELLGKWILEIIGRVRWSPATYSKFMVWPSYIQDENGVWVVDWVADSRILGHVYPFSTPQDILDALQGQINEQEKLREKDAEK